MPDSSIQNVGSEKVEETGAVTIGVGGTILEQLTTQEAQVSEIKDVNQDLRQ